MPESRLSGPLARLIGELKKLPGIGPRSAERIAFHLLKAAKDEALALSQSIADVKEKLRPCKRCFNLAEAELCAICSNGSRDRTQIVIVEQPKDLLNLESTGLVHGTYHVLMGRIAPLDGIGPEDLTIKPLLHRIKSEDVKEIVLATNPTLEGDATALYISELLQSTGVKITRLARGLPPGAQIEFANRSMLEEALRHRGAV